MVAALLAGCPGREIQIVGRGDGGHDYGYDQLLAAVARHAEQPVSPDQFRQFVGQVDQLAPQFNEDTEQRAELHTAFFAIEVVRAQREHPPAQQLSALALSVFPTAFRVTPRADESERAYLLRLCGTEKPDECRAIVPEGWPIVLTARARRRLKERAVEALSNCRRCEDVSTFSAELEAFSAEVKELDAEAARRRDDFSPRRWPVAAAQGQPWPDQAPLLSIAADGEARLNGEPVPPERRPERLRALRKDGRTLGVHLLPSDRVGTLRAIGAEARRVGYQVVALQARERQFPYPVRAYPLSVGRGRGARRADVREVDTIQILVRSLDAAYARSDQPVRL
jgi:hypothetical protein